MTPLSARRRSELRAEAHKLSPVVIIGDKGLTEEVLAEIDRSLKAHELIKVRAATDERDARAVWIETICERLEAHPVQQIGKVFVIYRENPKEEKKRERPDPGAMPRKRGARDDASRAGRGREKSRLRERDDGVKRISHPRSRTPSPRPESSPRRRRPRTSR
ncbi:MAG: ribosome assembly RNA-binding protein YhbY [Betaproteobacteria bacterium]